MINSCDETCFNECIKNINYKCSAEHSLQELTDPEVLIQVPSSSEHLSDFIPAHAITWQGGRGTSGAGQGCVFSATG